MCRLKVTHNIQQQHVHIADHTVFARVSLPDQSSRVRWQAWHEEPGEKPGSFFAIAPDSERNARDGRVVRKILRPFKKKDI